jgi:hypothetical protein
MWTWERCSPAGGIAGLVVERFNFEVASRLCEKVHVRREQIHHFVFTSGRAAPFNLESRIVALR